jgi:hypothetical protein
MDLEIEMDFTFTFKAYRQEGNEQDVISYFEKYGMKLLNIIKEPNKYDQYIFKGSFI